MDLRNYHENATETSLTSPTTTKKRELIEKSEAKKSIHSGHRQRLKKQYFEHGMNSLSDVQKLELLLFFAIPQKDTNPIAHELILECGSLFDVITSPPSKLMKVRGVKESTATFLSLIGSFLNSASRPQAMDIISSTRSAKEFCEKLYFAVGVEQFYAICLTKNNVVKNYKLIQSGTLDEVNVQIRHITDFALENKCNRIIVSHNHPTGFGIPSDEDATFTYSLICSCLLNSIDIVDHVIVGTDRTGSLFESGILDKLKQRAFQNVKISRETLAMISEKSSPYKNSLIEED